MTTQPPQSLTGLTRLGRRTPARFTHPDAHGSLYLGLQPPAPGPLSRLFPHLRPVQAQARHTTDLHLLAVGAGGQDLDLAATLLRPQVLYSLARGEQVLGIGHNPAEIDTRLRLAPVSGRRAAIACLPGHAAHAAPLLAAHPDLYVLLPCEGMDISASAAALNLPAHRILHSWDDADLIEMFAPVPQDSRGSAHISATLLQAWLAGRTGEDQRPAVVQIDLSGSALTLPALQSACAATRAARAQLVLHAMAWAQLHVLFGDQGVQTLIEQVSTVMTRETPGGVRSDPHSESSWAHAGHRVTAADQARMSKVTAAPYAAVAIGADGAGVVHLPPLDTKSFPAGPGGTLLTQPDFPRHIALLSTGRA